MTDQIVLPTHHRFKNLEGQTFGRLTVLRYAGPGPGRGQHLWLCRCVCGTEKAVRAGSLASGNTQSCGCLRKPLREYGGHIPTGRSTQGERRRRAPSYAELVVPFEEIRREQERTQEQEQEKKAREKLLRQGIISEKLWLKLFSESDESSPEMQAAFEEKLAAFQEKLGYFLQADLGKELSESELKSLLMMCVLCPPFPISVLRPMLRTLLSESDDQTSE